MIDTMLRDELQREFENLKDMKSGTEEHKVGVDSLTKLLDRAIEMDKFEADVQEKAENREVDISLKEKQMQEDKKDRIVKNCLTAVSLIASVGLTVWGSCKSWKFEETGTITSTAGREFMKKLFHMK